jgi:hypothetical protein
MKEFSLAGQRVETRLLVRHATDWVGYSYRWREDESDADLVAATGDRRFFDDQVWSFPTRSQCLDCHSTASGRSLGLETAQLNGTFVYPNGKSANQIATLARIGLFATDPGDPARLPRYATPTDDKTGSVTERARAYLHANCAHCHQPGGIKDELRLDFRYSTSFAGTNTCNRDPQKEIYGDVARKVLAPGSLEHSLIYYRMTSSSPAIRMPQIGTSVVDDSGAKVIADWITSLKDCPP